MSWAYAQDIFSDETQIGVLFIISKFNSYHPAGH